MKQHASQTKSPAIIVRDVCKNLADQEVLTGVNLKIKRGETLVIIGQSGCGKSVLLKHIIGLMHPDSGEIVVDGHLLHELNIRDHEALLAKFGMLFQGAALFDSLTIAENIAFRQIRERRMSRKQLLRLVDEKLALVGLSDIKHLKPAELSGGMQKRVGLARAIASDPEFILYDEPTTGLDPITADQINDLIIHLQDVLNVTSIAVTHDMVSASKIADTISMLYDGKIISTDTPASIKRTKNPFVRQFTRGEARGPISQIRGISTDTEETG